MVKVNILDKASETGWKCAAEVTSSEPEIDLMPRSE
jgi:hypothetical protein